MDQFDQDLENGILNGSALSNRMREQLKNEVTSLKNIPHLATIIVGDNPASKIYVKFKKKACHMIGITNTMVELPKDISQDDLEEEIVKLNENPAINGILLQLPLPNDLKEQKATMTISPDKDVDGLHYSSIGKMQVGLDGFLPCTPHGIIKMIEAAKVNLEGLNAVVVGRSNLVGKPILRLLEQRNATVTQCHSRTQNLAEICKRADVLIAAIGQPKMFNSDYVKEGAIVIDVGINRVDGKVTGDIDFNAVKEFVKYITPVPGGIGPMTITMLLYNTVKAYRMQNY